MNVYCKCILITQNIVAWKSHYLKCEQKLTNGRKERSRRFCSLVARWLSGQVAFTATVLTTFLCRWCIERMCWWIYGNTVAFGDWCGASCLRACARSLAGGCCCTRGCRSCCSGSGNCAIYTDYNKILHDMNWAQNNWHALLTLQWSTQFFL